MRKILFITGVWVCLGLQATAQSLPRVDIPGSEIRKIVSTKVPGQQYELQVLLPGGYQASGKKYPVLYLMDSQWDFPLAKSLYGQHYFDGFIPEMIIVGITWGGHNPNPDSLRARDYTPTNEKRLPQSGGAENFLAFIQSELFPFIQTTYRTDTSNRTLMGCSLGGLFTMYTLFTHPGMFYNYIAASPAYGWDKEILYQYEQKYFDSGHPLPARLYMTMGEVERGLPGFEKLTAHLNNRHYNNLDISSRVLENTGHSGTKTEGFGRGMQFAFQRPLIHPDAALLHRYEGKYTMADGNILEIKLEAGNLWCYLSPTNRYRLLAATEKDFYATSEFFNIRFWADATVEGLTLNRYGKTDNAKKQN